MLGLAMLGLREQEALPSIKGRGQKTETQLWLQVSSSSGVKPPVGSLGMSWTDSSQWQKQHCGWRLDLGDGGGSIVVKRYAKVPRTGCKG